MKKIILPLFVLISTLFVGMACAPGKSKPADTSKFTDSTPSIHQFSIESLEGDKIDLSKFKGKYILAVNTASKCGFTKQYKDLEALSKQYADKLVVIGFPSDNFGGQEFASNAEIAEFCEKNFGVTFPLTTKIDVKGDNANPIFKFLTHKEENGVLDAIISWNFNKFLLDKDGRLLAYFPSKVLPESEEVTKYLK